jgi:hypothetical protein
MKNRYSRYVNIMRTDEKVSIMLSWLNTEKPEGHQVETKHIDYGSDQILESVENAINALVEKWVHVFVSPFHMSAISECLDDQPKKFDLLADAEEPEQAFVSKYILGG